MLDETISPLMAAITGEIPVSAKPVETSPVPPSGDIDGDKQKAANDANNVVSDLLGKRKAGRHPKGCNCGRCLQSGGTGGYEKTANVPGQPAKVPAAPRAKVIQPVLSVAPPVSEADRALARQCVAAVTNLMDTIAGSALEMAAIKKGADKATCKQISEAAKMSEDCRSGIKTSGTAVLEKYGMIKLAPEATLALFLAQWTAGLTSTVMAILRMPDLNAEQSTENEKDANANGN